MSGDPARTLFAELSGDDSDGLHVEVQQERRFPAKKMGIMVALGTLLVMGAAVSTLQARNSKVQVSSGAFIELDAAKPPPILSSEQEGEELAVTVLETFSKAIGSRDFKSMMDLCAPEIYWSGSGNVPPADTYTKEKFFDGPSSVFGGSWGAMVSSFEPLNLVPVVDTQNGVVYIGFEVVLVADGHGKVPPHPVSIFRLRGNNFQFHVNSDKKITKWLGTWNPIDPAMGAALALLMPPQPAQPAPEVIITEQEGIDLVTDFLKQTHEQFATGEKPEHDHFADEIGWDWSGGVKGSGSKADFYKLLAGSWQKLASAFIPIIRNVVVDPLAGRVVCNFDILLILDGHGAVPVHDSLFSGKNMFDLQINKDKKITKFTGRWNSNDPTMGKMVGAVMAAAK